MVVVTKYVARVKLWGERDVSRPYIVNANIYGVNLHYLPVDHYYEHDGG